MHKANEVGSVLSGTGTNSEDRSPLGAIYRNKSRRFFFEFRLQQRNVSDDPVGDLINWIKDVLQRSDASKRPAVFGVAPCLTRDFLFLGQFKPNTPTGWCNLTNYPTFVEGNWGRDWGRTPWIPYPPDTLLTLDTYCPRYPTPGYPTRNQEDTRWTDKRL